MTITETKVFSTEAVMSVLTDLMMSPRFGDIHECVEHVLGHPVWTHGMATPALWESAKVAIYAAAPVLRDAPALVRPAEGLTGDAWPEAIRPWMEEVKAIVGDTVTLPKGTTERTKSPMETLAEMAPHAEVIVVDIDGAA